VLGPARSKRCGDFRRDNARVHRSPPRGWPSATTAARPAIAQEPTSCKVALLARCIVAILHHCENFLYEVRRLFAWYLHFREKSGRRFLLGSMREHEAHRDRATFGSEPFCCDDILLRRGATAEPGGIQSL
jgi:hypothetical protein